MPAGEVQVPPTLLFAVRTLKTSEAAALLNVSPNTLRAWERRFGYPQPQRSPGKHRLYTHGEVAALRDARPVDHPKRWSSAGTTRRAMKPIEVHSMINF